MSAVLQSTLSALTFSEVGQTITYTFTVTNTGLGTLTNIKVTDNLFGLIGVVPYLLSGQSQSFTESYTVTQTNINAGSIISKAIATAPSIGTLTNTTMIFASVVRTSGTGTLIIPLGATSFDVLLIGGGGAGGSRDTLSEQGGGGGGAGAVTTSFNNSLAGVTGINFSVGAGGQGVSALGANGNDGGTTSVTLGPITISATGGQGGRGASLFNGGNGGAGNNNGGGGGGAPLPGNGGSPNGQPGNNNNGGTGGAGSASNFNEIFSNAPGLGGLGGLCSTIIIRIGAGGGGGGGVGAADPSIKGSNPSPSDPSNGTGGTGYGAGGAGSGPALFLITTGSGASGAIVINYK